MKSYLDLIPVSYKIHKRQSRMTRICIFLSVFLVAVIFGMADMEIRSQKQQVIRNEGNWHAAFLHLDDEQAALIAARPEVDAASRYETLNYRMDTGYLLGGNETVICGMDKSFQELIPAGSIVEGSYPEGDNTVVLTRNAKERLGVEIGSTISLMKPDHTASELIVSGFMGDTSMLMSNDAVGICMNIQGLRNLAPEAGQDETGTMLYVRFTEFGNIRSRITEIISQFDLRSDQVGENVKLLALEGQSSDNYMMTLYVVAAILAILVVTAGVLMMAGSLNSNIAQRTEFFGLLRCLGATKKQIVRFVRREALSWCRAAIPLGLLSGILVVWILCAMLKIISFEYFEDMPVLEISWLGMISGILVGVITVLLAARAPAKRASQVSPLTAVLGNATMTRPVRKAAGIHILPIELALGVHHAKSGRKNFLLMAGSFSFSIILFLAFSSAVDFMNHAVRPMQPFAPDISISGYENQIPAGEALKLALDKMPQVKKVYGRMTAMNVPIRINGQQKIMNLISYEKHQFDWAEDMMVDGSLNPVKENGAALAVYHDDTILKTGSILELDTANGIKQITIAGNLSNSPIIADNTTETIICSEDTFRALIGETGYSTIDIQLTAKATDKDIETIRSLAATNTHFADHRLKNSEAKGAYYSFVLFIYGFLAVIALISVFNIINSIAMSVSAHLKQYGAMRAVGMSDTQLVKMITAEAFTYTVCGVVAGSILGLLINKQLFEWLITSHWGDTWVIPINSLTIIIMIVISSMILAVWSPMRRIRKMTIVETINT